MKTTDLSIIIVTFNNQDIIRECLQSISRYFDSLTIELILIDNQSTDQTRDILSESWPAFAHKHCIFNEQNEGYTRGVNQGLKIASGKYILMLNPDVIFPQAILYDLFEMLDDFTAVVVPQLRYPDGRIQPSCRRFPQKSDVLFESLGLSKIFPDSDRWNRWRMPQFDHKTSRFVEQPQGAFLLTTRETLEKIGLLDERFYMFFSDVEWCRRVYENGFKILFAAEHFVYHVHGASVRKKRKKMILTSHRSFIQYFQKYDKTFGQKCLTAGVWFLLAMGTIPRLICASWPFAKR